MLQLIEICCFFTLLTTLSQSQNIILNNNGYEGVLIAISDDIPFSDALIPQIREVFNRTSALLFSSTKYRAYFREVTILVPSSWNINVSFAKSETFDQANIRIDLPSPRHGGRPFVSQPAECGVPGEFMQLTPEFFFDKKADIAKYGPTEKVIVHEWGHLRWGLFDEYPLGNNAADHFYVSPTTNTVEASRCSSNIAGVKENRLTGKACKLNLKTGLPEDECRFYASTDAKHNSSSLMSYQYIPHVTEFCDSNDLVTATLHNIEAPTRQNRLCNMQSSWEVMKQSKDFAKGANPGLDNPNFNTTVSFTIVKQRPEDRVVVVMDVSASMDKDRNYLKLVSAVIRYLMYTIRTNSWVGLVKYSTYAESLTPALVQVSDDSSRESLAKLVVPTKEGNTAIGQGLLRALEVLKGSANNSDVTGSRIILLTDGEETEGPMVSEVEPRIKEAGVVVDAILLTKAASNNLISFAARTGGTSFFSSGSDMSTSLMDAYAAIERSHSRDPSKDPITIISKIHQLQPSETFCFHAVVDESLGFDTTFVFAWIVDSDVNITLTSPTNKVISPDFVQRNGAGYREKGPGEVGTWKVCLRNFGSQLLNVTSQVVSGKSKDVPIKTRATIINSNPNFKTESKPVIIYATVENQYRIINAKVIALIESPNAYAPPTLIDLRDNGFEPDNEKDDGVYSGYVLATNDTGKHTVIVKVKGTNTTEMKVETINPIASALLGPGEHFGDEQTKMVPTGDFERHLLVGFFDVIDVKDPLNDVHAPSMITDFSLGMTSVEEGLITFQWTAVGDDKDQGTASSYELWKAYDFKAFLPKYANATRIEPSEVVQGSLTRPLPSYSNERITIRAENESQVLLFGIIAIDEAGNKGKMSNIVSVNSFRTVDDSHLSKKVLGSNNTLVSNDRFPLIPIAIGSAVSAIVLIGGTLSVFIVFKKKSIIGAALA